MPLSFIAVLIGIITMSGVPPLSGFGGRWIFYNAIMSTDLRLPLILVFMAGPVGFCTYSGSFTRSFLGNSMTSIAKSKRPHFGSWHRKCCSLRS